MQPSMPLALDLNIVVTLVSSVTLGMDPTVQAHEPALQRPRSPAALSVG